MIGYVNGERVDLTRKVVNPNLIPNSKRLEMNVSGSKTIFGQFLKINPTNIYSIYLSDSETNPGLHADGTSYLSIEKNTFYTETLWFTTDISISPNFSSNLKFTAHGGYTETMAGISTKTIGNNQYKVSGFFNSKEQNSIDLAYITSFGTQCLNTKSELQVRFDAVKLEKGTESTDWCPAYDDYAMQSDLDDLKAQIEQLKSK